MNFYNKITLLILLRTIHIILINKEISQKKIEYLNRFLFYKIQKKEKIVNKKKEMIEDELFIKELFFFIFTKFYFKCYCWIFKFKVC